MAATHRDLPPGSQKWAEEMDALRDEVKTLKALCARMAQDLRIDPRDPSKNINPQNDSPTVRTPVQAKLSGLADTDTFDVADGQVLTWSQIQQAWRAQTPANGSGDFMPQFTDYLSGSAVKQAHGSPSTGGKAAWWAWDTGGNLEAMSVNGTFVAEIGLNSYVAEMSVRETGSGRRAAVQIMPQGGTTAPRGVFFQADYLGMPKLTATTRAGFQTMIVNYGTAPFAWDPDLKKVVVFDEPTNTWRDANGTAV